MSSESTQLLRQWKLLQLLADSRVGIPIAELTKLFEISDRNMRRDIALLKAAGFELQEVVGDRGVKRWKMKPFSEQLQFNYADLIAVVISRRFLEPLAGTPFWEGHQKIYQKVRGALGENAFRFCDKLHRMIRITGFGNSDYSKRGQIIDTILQAIEDKRRVLIVYQSMQSTEPVEQELGPQGLIWHNGSLYLIAWSARRQEIRNYKIDRIENAEIGSDLKYAVPENFSLEEWQQRAFGVFHGGGDDDYSVVIHFHRAAARYVQEAHWHEGQKFFPQPDGSVHMHLQVTELSAVMKWILGFGTNAIAIEPPELLDQIRRELSAMTDCYQSNRHSPSDELRFQSPMQSNRSSSLGE